MNAKLIGMLACLILFGGLLAQADAATLSWDRSAETDMKDYQVWACFTPNCVVIKSPGMLQGTPVVQTAPGVRPSISFAAEGKEGAVAISARDQSLNESGLSVPFPFDKVAPGAPVGLTLQ